MKPHPSISPARRTLIATAVVLATGSIAVFAQSTSSQGSSSSPGSSSTSSSGWSSGSTGSTSYGSSSGMSGTTSTSMSAGSMTGMSTSQSGSMASSSGKLGWTDRRFVTKAAEDGQDELQLAQLASQKATNPDVKSYAEQLVQQHQQVNSELMSIANQRNVKIDKEESNTRAYKRLNKASSQDFDREFVDHMIDEHEKDIKLFQKAASDAKDPQVRDFASRHVADLQQHLQMAQRLQSSVAATGEETGHSGQSYRGSSSSTSSTSSTESTTSTGTGSSSSGYGSGGSSSSAPSTSR